MSWDQLHGGSEELEGTAFVADYPLVGPLLMLDAGLAVTTKFLLQPHDELDQPDGPKVGKDEPPLPWLAGPILDQMEALRRSIDRYLPAVAQDSSCCYLCLGAGRACTPTPDAAAAGAVR